MRPAHQFLLFFLWLVLETSKVIPLHRTSIDMFLLIIRIIKTLQHEIIPRQIQHTPSTMC